MVVWIPAGPHVPAHWEVLEVTQTYETQAGSAGHGVAVVVQPAHALTVLASETGVPIEAPPVYATHCRVVVWTPEGPQVAAHVEVDTVTQP